MNCAANEERVDYHTNSLRAHYTQKVGVDGWCYSAVKWDNQSMQYGRYSYAKDVHKHPLLRWRMQCDLSHAYTTLADGLEYDSKQQKSAVLTGLLEHAMRLSRDVALHFKSRI